MDEHSNVLCQMKETRLKRLDPVWFHYCDSLEKTKYRERQQIISCQELMVEEGLIIKRAAQGNLGAGAVLYLHFGSRTALCICQNNCTTKRVNFISRKSKIKLKSFSRKGYKYIISHSLSWQKFKNLTMPIWQFQVWARMTYILLAGM